jgi:transposase
MKVAQDLGIAESMLYSWRSKRRLTGQYFEKKKLHQAEISRLKREKVRLEGESASLKKAAAADTCHGKAVGGRQYIQNIPYN